MDLMEAGRQMIYQIRIWETLKHSFAPFADEVEIEELENGQTLLTGTFVDQPALRGFLDRLWNLNLTLVSVELVEEQRETNRS